MMPAYTPAKIPIEIFPGDWCWNCNDPGHEDLKECSILTGRKIDGKIIYSPCGCTHSLTFGKQGEYFIRVTEWQKE